MVHFCVFLDEKGQICGVAIIKYKGDSEGLHLTIIASLVQYLKYQRV